MNNSSTIATKTIALFLALGMSSTLTACQGADTNEQTPSTNQPSSSQDEGGEEADGVEQDGGVDQGGEGGEEG